MTHYQKLATMIFRIVGAIFIIGSLIQWIPAFLVAPPSINPFMILFNVLPYLVIGMVLFALSRSLARWVCFDFDKFSEQ